MKIKQIESLLKDKKTIIVSEGKDCQWLGNGDAMYPVYGLPRLSEENLFVMFDVPEEKRMKFHFEERALPEGYSFADACNGEKMLTRGAVSIVIHGRTLVPLLSSHGAVYIDERYLRPFSDLADGYDLYERIDKNNHVYIAVKTGFLLCGLIMPYDVVNRDFVDLLGLLHRETSSALVDETQTNAKQEEFDL